MSPFPPRSRAFRGTRHATAALLLSIGIAGAALGGCSQTKPGKAYRPGNSDAIFLNGA